MSFFFDDTNPDFRCKECGAQITIDQYQRLEYCDMCQDTYDLLTHGHIVRNKKTPIEINAIIVRECYDGWELDFMLKLEAYEEKRKRLR